MGDNFRFFRNANCFYFPCHETEDDKEFNCQFCYCPLYFFPDCGGRPTLRGKVKDCSQCDKPHRPDGYEHVMTRLTRYFEELHVEPQDETKDKSGQNKPIGTFCWNELMTSDCQGARKFYEDLFGWSISPMGSGTYLVARAGERPVGGITVLPAAAPGSQAVWTASVRVADAEATAKKALELGGTVIVPPRDIPGLGRFCVLRDPQGAILHAVAYLADQESDGGESKP